MPIINTIIKRKIDNYADKDSAGNIIIDTYATKSSIPTLVSKLTNDAGYITKDTLVDAAISDAKGNVIDSTYAFKSSIPTKVSDLINDLNFIDSRSDITGTASRAIGDSNGNIIINTYAPKTSVPTKLSQLTNDIGYITAKGAVNKCIADANGNVISDTYALKTSVPTKLSQLENNSGFITSTDIIEKAISDANGNNIINTYATKASVPTKVSQLENDIEYITNNLSEESGLTWKDKDNKAIGSITFKNYSGLSNMALKDSDGNKIVDTYSTKVNTISEIKNYESTITYKKADGTSGVLNIPNTTYNVFTGASTTKDGLLGLVPQPTMSSNINQKVLCANGKWDIPQYANVSGSTIKASQDANGNIINNTYSLKPIQSDYTWTANSETLVIDNNYITSTSVIIIKTPISISKEQYIAFDNAKITCTNQSTGVLSLTAYGTIPTIDIPIVLVILK